MPAKFVRELFVQYRRKNLRPFSTEKIASARDVYRAVRHLMDRPREHLLALLLDAQNRIIGYETVSIGTTQVALVDPGCVFQSAILCGAVGVILVHNHPSGDPHPSQEDKKITTRLHLASEVIGIKLLDHIVVSDSGYFSFSDAGQLRQA